MKSPYTEDQMNVEKESSAVKVAKVVTIVASLAAVGFVAVTTTINSNTPIGDSSRSHSITKLNVKTVNKRPVVPEYTILTDGEKLNMFEDFANKFGRKYLTDSEKQEKFQNFQKFLQLVDQRNTLEKKGTAVHGVTKFADMDETEFKASLLGYRTTNEADNSMKKIAIVPKYSGSETSKNWAGIYTTDVKDQGYCGSCWAFSATEQIESDAVRQGLLTVDDELSPQQIVSCDSKDYGCSGGNTETAYRYVKRNGGIALSANYPYTSYYGTTGNCATNNSPKINVVSFSSVASEEDMKSYVLSTGPLSICIDASLWSSYTSGIVSTCGTSVDHCVQVVGVNTEEGYWIVRNSWGENWGEGGYIRLATDSNMCNISYDPTYTTVEAV